MMLSITELKAISELGNGKSSITELATTLKISKSQVYRIAEKLNRKGIVALSEGELQPEKKTHVSMLLKLLAKASNLANPLSGTGMQIYQAIIEPKTVKEIETETCLHKSTVLKKIRQGRKMSLLLLKNRTCQLNDKIWPDAIQFFIELQKYEYSLDQRIPINSIIYSKNSKEIIFSNNQDIDAQKTAFSAYENYGIKLLLLTNYYYLPKKSLTKKEVFIHSIYVTEKSQDMRHLIYVALYFAKYKNELSKIRHPIVENLKKILLGEKIAKYPSLEEIKDRAQVYNVGL
ncbi:MAG: helix-turn-helix domain-containing protein [archaeon]